MTAAGVPERHHIAKPTHEHRIQWVDAAKAIAICLVVAYHVGGAGMDLLFPNPNGASSTLWAALNEALLPVRMPLFFACAGILAHGALPRPWRMLWHPRVVTLLWPYLIWSLAFVVIAGFAYQPDSPAAYAVQVLISTPLLASPYWFLPMLALFFATAKLLRTRPTPALGVALVLAIAAPVVETYIPESWPSFLTYAITRAARYIFWYLLGAYALNRLKRVAAITPAYLLAGGGIAFVAASGLAYVTDMRAELTFIRSVGGLVAAVGVSVWLTKYERVRRTTRFLAGQTMPIYLLHPVLLVIIALLLGSAEQPNQTMAGAVTPVVSVLLIVAAIAIHGQVKGTRASWLFVAPGWTSPRALRQQ